MAQQTQPSSSFNSMHSKRPRIDSQHELATNYEMDTIAELRGQLEVIKKELASEKTLRTAADFLLEKKVKEAGQLRKDNALLRGTVNELNARLGTIGHKIQAILNLNNYRHEAVAVNESNEKQSSGLNSHEKSASNEQGSSTHDQVVNFKDQSPDIFILEEDHAEQQTIQTANEVAEFMQGKSSQRGSDLFHLNKDVESFGLMKTKRVVPKSYPVVVVNFPNEFNVGLLEQEFKPFGEIIDIDYVQNPATLEVHGIVSYSKPEEAENAINSMNEKLVKGNKIHVCTADDFENDKKTRRLSYEDILSKSRVDDNSIYIKNIPSNAIYEDFCTAFKRFGDILGIRIFGNRGYAFVKFGTKESAARAIYEMDGTEFMDTTISCWWCLRKGPIFDQNSAHEHPSNLSAPYFRRYSSSYNTPSSNRGPWNQFRH